MARLNYALVSERPSKTSIYRKGWRPNKPKLKPYAKLAADIGAAAAIMTKKRLHGDIRSRARQEPIVWMDVDPSPLAHNFEAPALNIDHPNPVRHHPEISTNAPKARSAWTLSASPVLETPSATCQEPVVRIDVDPAPRAHNLEAPAWNIDSPGLASADAPKSKSPWTVAESGSPWKLLASLGLESTSVSSRKCKAHEESPAPTAISPSAACPKTKWAHNFEAPALNIDGPGLASADAPKSRSPWTVVESGSPWKLLSLGLGSTSVSSRKRKAREESPEPTAISPPAAYPNVKKARIGLPAKSSPISSRKAEKSRARDEPVDIPLMSLRKAEKARARDDLAETVNVIPPASLKTAKEPRLPGPIRPPIVTANMASSSRVKLEDMPLPASANGQLSTPVLTDVQVKNTSLTSLDKQIENSVLLPREPTIVASSAVRQPENFNDVADVIMFEDDYVEPPSIIGGYDTEYGLYMQIDSIGAVATHNDNIPFNLGVFAMLGYVPEFSEKMEVEWVGPSVPSGNNAEGLHNPGAPYAGQPVMENIYAPNLSIARTLLNPHVNGPLHAQLDPGVFLPNAPIVDPPYDPREPLFAPRPHAIPQIVEDNVLMRLNIDIPVTAHHVQPPAPEALNAPASIPVQEQSIGHADDRVELFNELFGDDGEEEDEEEDEEAGAPWTAGDDRAEEHGDGEDEDEVEFII